MRLIELIGKFFHNLILYLLFIFVCLLPKLTPGNTGGLTAWWISKPEIERYKTVPVWRNHESWCEPSDVPQDTSCTHVSWHIRRWCLTWVPPSRWWSGRVLSLVWFLIFLSWCKYSVFFQKRCRIPLYRCRIPTNATPFLTYFFISRCVFLLFIEKWLVLLFILCGYIFSHFLPPFGRSTAFF